MTHTTRIASIRQTAEPMIARAAHDLCKQHCRGERYRWRCAIDAHWGRSPHDAPLCDRGNETYDWLWRDLLGGRKIEKFMDSDADGIARYFQKTLGSQSFYERFKDMRYGDRVRVPAYILALGAVARRVFWLLRKQQPAEAIAQAVEQPEPDIRELIREIRTRLHAHGASRLLHPVVEVTLTQNADESPDSAAFVCDASTIDDTLTEMEEQNRADAAFRKLSWQEQYVIEALTLEKLAAHAVLAALTEEGIVIDGVNQPHLIAKQGAEQRLYYFHRKALAHLRQLYESELHAPCRRDTSKRG